MDYSTLRTKLKEHFKLDYSGYRDSQIQRRLDTFLQKRNLSSYSALLVYLKENREAVSEMRDYLAVNVSEFFRNNELFEFLSESIMPVLRKLPSPKMWSAGCSIGCEAYTLAILGNEFLRGNWSVMASDIDSEALKYARAGVYSQEEVKLVSKAYREKYFVPTPQGRYAIKDFLRAKVSFDHLDLLQDAYPSSQDLILCRNVVIYFTDEAKNSIFAKLSQALQPGGYLFIGATESFHNYKAYNLVKLHPCFYQKI